MEISDEYILSNSTENIQSESLTIQNGFSLDELWGDSSYMGSFTSDDRIDQNLPQFSDFDSFNHLYLNVVSQSVNDNEIINLVNTSFQDPPLIKSDKKCPRVFPFSSLEILRKYRSRVRSSKPDPRNQIECNTNMGQTLSIDAVLRLAAQEFIQSSSRSSDELPELSHPYASSIFNEDFNELKLIRNLLSCAEKVGEGQYERARMLLLECDKMSSSIGNPVERLAFYFMEALYEKIDREMGKFTGKPFVEPHELLKSSKATLIAFHEFIPLSQITKFAGTQAIVERVVEVRKIHVIDLQIRNGVHCTILMQALASRNDKHPLEYLRFTTVGLGPNSRSMIEETGQHLTSFAQSLNLKFLFNVVVVDSILDLNEKHLEINEDETIVVYADYVLMNWIGRPDCLDHLMLLIKALDPCVMIVSEAESNCNSPIFVERFVEALFFYGSFFESMADCLKHNEENRRVAESTCFGLAIRNILAAEGEGRKIRHISIDIWRAYFERFGLVEMELSMASLYQAKLILKNFECGKYWTFDTNDKSLIIGWNGSPLSSLSVWSFKK